MSEIDEMLYVTATSAVHQRIKELLQHLAASRSRQIAYEARYITMPLRMFERINHELAGGDLMLDRQQTDKLVDQINSNPEQLRFVATARTVAANRQRVFLDIYRSIDMLDDDDTGEGSDDDQKQDAPPTEATRGGANVFDVEGIIDAEHAGVIVTLRATLARSKAAVCNFRTTVRLPDGGAVLLAASGGDESGKSVPEGHELVLFLRATATPASDQEGK
ncbi:hypothetical protein HED60_04335 [Planctomycetales bacterium ZRK34]|nr:hypothetical protein HED60_04335 [Planctomycetales bacterium ZRK34]